MKILLLLTELFRIKGGIQNFNLSFLRAINDLAGQYLWNVKVFVLNDDPCDGMKLLKDFKNIDFQLFGRNKLKFFITAVFQGLAVDKVIFGHINFAVIAMFMPNKVYKYLVVHGIEVYKKLSCWLLQMVLKMHKVLSVSQYTKHEMIRLNPSLASQNFIVFPNTLSGMLKPLNNFHMKTKNELNLPDWKLILTVSRLDSRERYKNIDLILEAMQEVLSSVPDVCCVIVGDGSDKKRLEQKMLALGLEKNVFFVGNVSGEDLYSYYSLCDLFVLPSTGEGFGIVFLEAMYFSSPCIGARSRAVPEVIEDASTGILCNPDDVKDLVSAMIKLLQDSKLRFQYGTSGKKKFEQCFSFDAFRQRLEKVLCS